MSKLLDFEVQLDPEQRRGQMHPMWRDAVSTAAVVAMYQAGQTEPINLPVDLTITFRLRRVHPGRQPTAPKSNVWPSSNSAVPLLLQSTVAALVACGCVSADSRFCDVSIGKTYATVLKPGAHIVIEAL